MDELMTVPFEAAGDGALSTQAQHQLATLGAHGWHLKAVVRRNAGLQFDVLLERHFKDNAWVRA